MAVVQSVGWLRFPPFLGKGDLSGSPEVLVGTWLQVKPHTWVRQSFLLLGVQSRGLTLCLVCYFPPVHLAYLTGFFI